MLTLLVWKSSLQDLDRHKNWSKYVIEIMGNAACKRAYALHSLRSEKLRFELFPFRDIGTYNKYRFWFSIIANQCPAAFHNDSPAVFSYLLQLASPLSLLNCSLAGVKKLV